MSCAGSSLLLVHAWLAAVLLGIKRVGWAASGTVSTAAAAAAAAAAPFEVCRRGWCTGMPAVRLRISQ